MRKLWANSLMVRLVTSFLLLSWLIVSLVSAIAYLRASKALERSIFERLNLAATFKEEELNLWVEERRQDVLNLAHSLQIQRQAEILINSQSGASERDRAYTYLAERLNTLYIGESDLQEILIIAGESGEVILSTDQTHIGQNRRDEKYFLQGKLATFIHNVYPSPESGVPLMTIATPLFNQQGRHLGVIAIHLNLDQVDAIIQERAGMGATGETYLVDTSNQFVSSQRFGRNAFSGGVHSAGIEAALLEQDGSGLYRNYADVPVIGVYRWIEDRELALLAEMHQQEALAPARKLAITILLTGLGSAGALAVGIYLLARQIAHPILAMAETVARVTQGDLSQTIPVFTQDEIGTLAQAFNQMIAQLRDLLDTLEQRVAARTRDLRIAADVSKQITTVLDIDEVLHRVVLSTAQSFHLYACSVFLMDEVHPQLVETASANARGDLLLQKGLTIPLDAQPSIIALAARTRKAVVIGDVQSRAPITADRREVPVASVYLATPYLPETRSELAIPMIRGDVLIGVFDLQSQHVHHFRAEDVRVLTTLAEQLAIAVRNAKLFAEMQQARRKAEAASEAKSEFLANVSHELRTPLTSVMGFTKIIKKRLRDVVFPAAKAGMTKLEHQKAHYKVQRAIQQVDANVDIVVSESERLTALINDVLDLARIETGKIEWDMQQVQIADVITQALTATAVLFEANDLELLVDVADDLPPVLGDAKRLVQVLVNLISNAVKFTDVGQIRILARLASPPTSLEISVQDTGPGIAPEFYDKVFAQFEQISDTTTGKPQGTGLGLPICKHIIDYHGGCLWVESEPGKGSCFTFSLPLFLADSVTG